MSSDESSRDLIKRIERKPDLFPAVIDQQNRRLAAAKGVKGIVKIRKLVSGLIGLARRIKLNRQKINRLVVLNLECIRKAGRILQNTLRRGRPQTLKPREFLKKMGLSKDQSSQYQKMSKPPDDELKGWIKDGKDNGRELSQNGWLKFAQQFILKNRASQTKTEKQTPTPAEVEMDRLIKQRTQSSCILLTPYANRWDSFSKRKDRRERREIGWAELGSLPIGELAPKNARLYIWVTSEHLFRVPALIKRWDFTVAAPMICNHITAISNDDYFRYFHSYLVIGTRGARESNRCDQRGMRNVSTNSREEFEQRLRSIVMESGSRSFLHLFGAILAENWTVESLSFQKAENPKCQK